ncbi:MAG: hypothetical protein JXB33_04590, partial [Clostridia bacterium]|nr:hypothetical protein [Clostridia bacterium]
KRLRVLGEPEMLAHWEVCFLFPTIELHDQFPKQIAKERLFGIMEAGFHFLIFHITLINGGFS